MKRMMRRIGLVALTWAVAAAAIAQSGPHARTSTFASDEQTVPVMANAPGLGGTFQSYVALYNPTASAYTVTASLYDTNGFNSDAMITLAPGELKTYSNFLDSVFHFSGGGAVTFQSPESAGGTHNNRFVISTEVRTGGTGFSTPVPVVEFDGTSSPSFSPGVTVDANSRVNVGCVNQSDEANTITATVLDSTGALTLGSVTLDLAPRAWGQVPVTTVVSGGTVRFEPSEPAVCYAVVVSNATNDGRLITAAEYTP